MKQLDAVRDPPPREEGIVRWLASDFETIGGLALFGFMWVGLSIALLVFIPEGFYRLLGERAILFAGGLFVVLQAAFIAWAASRRAAARRLFREGVLVDARITKVVLRKKRGLKSTTAFLAFGSGADARRTAAFFGGHQSQLEVGQTIPVLFLEGSRYCAVFSHDGAPKPAAYRRA